MPTNTADDKRAEALANEIADALRQLQPPARITVRRDPAADTWTVRVTVGRVPFDLIVPAPGAWYPLFRRNRFIGFGRRADEAPVTVAAALLLRIDEVL